jgi:uncharacterized RDD family membrane protein YckC
MEKLIKNRFKAFIIDISILGILGIFILVIFMININKHFLYIYGLMIAIIYSLFFCKDIINGQSIGKRILKLQIVSENGKPASLKNVIIRNVIALLQPIDALYMINNRGNRLGDIICKTKIVNTPQKDIYKFNPLLLIVCVIIVFFITLSFFFIILKISRLLVQDLPLLD